MDTRVLAFNQTTLKKLNLKLPPPYEDWGTPYYNQWTWDKMVEYAEKIQDSGIGTGFNFQAGWDEEVRLLFYGSH